MRKEIIASPGQFIILSEADWGNRISVLSVYDIKKKKKELIMYPNVETNWIRYNKN